MSRSFNFKACKLHCHLQNGKCVDIVYGADVPSVARKVEKHLSMKQYGDDDKAGRYYFEFDEMVADERAEYERQKAIDDVSNMQKNLNLKNYKIKLKGGI